MPQPLPLRAIQLDLARQMETLPYLRDFIDFAATFGYNALHLYLEARVRTASFPWPDETTSYSAQEIRELVAYAESRGMQVIPQVNCMSHAELFLRHDALSELGELREPEARGRFGAKGPGNTFCPSLEATRDFLRTYLAEVAALFPGEWFHVGLDEVWEIGRCSRCRQRLAEGESQDDLFADHLLFLHEVVTEGLGKRMMMWDDMLEEYPGVIEKLPADIVQCVWQYGSTIETTSTHFGHKRWDRRLADFAARGIDCLICPGPGTPMNVETLTQHASAWPLLGGIMTVWEKSSSFLFTEYPTIAFAGRLWESGNIWAGFSLFQQTVAELMHTSSHELIGAIRACVLSPGRGSLHLSQESMRGPITAGEMEHYANLELMRRPLAETPFHDSRARHIAEDLLIQIDLQRVGHALRHVQHQAYRHWAGLPATDVGRLLASLTTSVAHLHELARQRAEQWQRYRPGLPLPGGQPLLSGSLRAAETLLADLTLDRKRVGLLSIRYALPDQYGAQRVRWQLQREGSDAWESVYEGVPKPRESLAEEQPFYTLEHPLPNPMQPPRRLRLQSWGYGGIGVCYVQYEAAGQRKVPERIDRCDGKVERTDAILRNDTFWCQIGEEDVRAAFHDPARADAIHTIELSLTNA